jgi:hypothetical protein
MFLPFVLLVEIDRNMGESNDVVWTKPASLINGFLWIKKISPECNKFSYETDSVNVWY